MGRGGLLILVEFLFLFLFLYFLFDILVKRLVGWLVGLRGVWVGLG